jgi:hypothetical protein
MSLKHITLILYMVAALTGCAPNYSCSDSGVLQTVKESVKEILEKQIIYLTGDVNLELITLESIDNQTGKAYCKAKIQFDVNEQMMYGRMPPPETSIPKSGIVEFTINKDQTNSGKLVVWTVVKSIE